MNLSNKAIQDFRRIYKEKRGIDLTAEQADQMGWKLLQLTALTLKQHTND